MGRKKEEIQGGLPIQDLEDYTRLFVLALFPTPRGNSGHSDSARSSDFWITQAPASSRRVDGSDIAADVVPSYSGGTVRELHPLPVDRTILSGRTVDDQ